MTSRERVYASLAGLPPDRTPRDLWALPYVQLFRKAELDDMLRRFPLDFDRPELSPGSDDADLQKYSAAGKYVDEWGSVWRLAEPGIVGEVKEPVLSDWNRLSGFRPPWDFIRTTDWAYINRLCARSEKFMLSGVCARPFERLQFLRGSENLYIDLAYDTKELRTLLGMVHDFYLEDVSNWTRSEVDGVAFMDDWGSNRGLLVSPDLWRKMFKPLYRDYCEIVHRGGKKAFFHSDGNIASIYGDLIEVGIDAINSQLFCMDIEALGELYAGRVTFWGEIDRQQILPYGTAGDVRAAVHRVRRALARDGAGVIAQCEWGKDNSPENIEAVFRAWEEPLPGA